MHSFAEATNPAAPYVAGPPMCVVAHAGPGPCWAAVLLHCDAKFAGLQGQHNQLSWCATPMMLPAVHMQLCQFACSAFQYVATNAATRGHNAAALPTFLWRVQPRAPTLMLAAVCLPFGRLLSALSCCHWPGLSATIVSLDCCLTIN